MNRSKLLLVFLFLMMLASACNYLTATNDPLNNVETSFHLKTDEVRSVTQKKGR